MLVAAKNQKGFSLIEVSIVLIIIALLFSSVILSQGERLNDYNRKSTKNQLFKLESLLLTYFSVNNAFPCPASASSQGFSQLSASKLNQCESSYGYVPIRELNTQGKINSKGLLIDSWNKPIHYILSPQDYNNNDAWDWITPSDLTSVSTLSQLEGNLSVCNDATCSDLILTKNAIFVLYSRGKSDYNSDTEVHNRLSNSLTFAQTNTVRNSAGFEFDDILIWTSPLQVYPHLIFQFNTP